MYSFSFAHPHSGYGFGMLLKRKIYKANGIKRDLLVTTRNEKAG